MKNVKNLVLKGMLVGVALAAGVGAVVPRMKSDSVVMAAETENTAQTEVYTKCIKGEEDWWYNYYLQYGGTGYKGEDGTYYINGNGVNYEISFTVTEYRTRSEEHIYFRTEEQALEYGQERGWENVHVEEAEDEWHSSYYKVYGVTTMGTVTVKTIPLCCPSESME